MWGRKQREENLGRELRTHLELEAEERQEDGLPLEAARHSAQRSLGNLTLIKEDVRQMWTWISGERLIQDLCYAARTLRKSPMFTVAAVLTLALGIGANTAIFSVVNAVLLRPLSYKNPDRLAMIWTDDPRHDVHEEGVSYPNFEDWRTASHSFEDMAICSRNNPVTLTGGQTAQRADAAIVSGNLFAVLGVQPELGRAFSPDEVLHGDRVILLSHGLWQDRFGGSPDAIGKTLELDGAPWRVIGVMPASFQFPAAEVQLWQQLTSFRRWRNIQRERYSDWGRVIGRLRPGVTVTQAQAELNTIGKRLEHQYPPSGPDAGDFAGFSVNAVPLALQVTGRELPTALWVLFGAVLFVLLISCVNVANLLLARGASREREITLRHALGAGRGRILRQLLTESLMLACVAGALGMGVAVLAVRGLIASAPPNLPHLDQVRVDPGVLAFCACVSLLAVILFGLVPALRLSQGGSTLNRRGSHTTRQSVRMGSLLVVAEFALSSVLLCGTGLMIRSFLQAQAVQPGFQPSRVLTMRIAATGSDAAAVPFFGQILERVAALPGVTASGMIEDVLQRRNPDYQIMIAGRAGQSSEPVSGDAISPGCFETLGVRLLKGRLFTDRDKGGTPVAIINETMAQHLWPNQDPIGKQFREADGLPKHPWYSVVGVVADMHRQGLERQPIAQIFWPYFQRVSSTMDLVLRSASDPTTLTAAVREQVRSLDKNAPVFDASTLERRLDQSLSPRRFQSLLLGLLAAIALGLTAIGVYGLMHYSVALRTNEIGIRMALGAQAGEVLRMIIGQGMILALIGLVAGAAGSLLVTRMFSSLLFGVTATDPITFTLVPALIGAVALVACCVPAWRAARVDPTVALKYE